MYQIYIGELIKNKVAERQMSVADFAKAINCSRSSVYMLFNSRDISVLRLLDISRVLEYDFVSEICKTTLLQRIKDCEIPFIAIPIREGKADFSALPHEVCDWLKDSVACSVSNI